MNIVKKGDFLFLVERVKNDKNGNPRFEIIVIWLTDKPINFNYELSFLGHRIKKDYSRILVSSYNIDDTINYMYKDCIVKSLIIKNVLNSKEVELLEKYCRIDVVIDNEELTIKNSLYPNYIPMLCRYKNKVYSFYLN